MSKAFWTSTVLAWAFAALPAIAAPRTPEPPEARGQLPPLPDGYRLMDRIVAFVNDEILTLFEVEQAVAANLSLAGMDPEMEAAQVEPEAVRKESLDALIDSILVLGAAKELGLEVSEREATQQLERIKAQSGWDDEQLRENIGRLGFPSVEAYREFMRKEILKARTVSIKVGSRVNVTSADVQRVLDARFHGGTRQDEVRASLILRRLPPAATESEVKEAYRFMQWLRDQAAAAPERFADLARKYSEHDATRLHGGDLGFFTRGTFAEAAIEESALATPVGQVSEVVRTQQGYQILLVTDRRTTPVRDLETLKDTIYDQLIQEEKLKAYRRWVGELRDQAYVEVPPTPAR